MSFYYEIGKLTTTDKWFRPDKDLLKTWYSQIKELQGFSKYTYYAGDSLLKVEKTWDVDVLMTGEIDDYEELRDFLNDCIQLGFEHRQLIDIYHVSNIFTWEDGFKPYNKIRSWTHQKKVINGKTTIDKIMPYTEEIIEGLYKIKHDKTPPKSYIYWQEMFAKGIYENEKRLLEDVLR